MPESHRRVSLWTLRALSSAKRSALAANESVSDSSSDLLKSPAISLLSEYSFSMALTLCGLFLLKTSERHQRSTRCAGHKSWLRSQRKGSRCKGCCRSQLILRNERAACRAGVGNARLANVADRYRLTVAESQASPSQGAEAARRICESLQSGGIEVWLEQFKACALFLPVISANTSARSEGYFRLEWKLAVDRSHLMATERAFILPLVIDGTSDQMRLRRPRPVAGLATRHLESNRNSKSACL